MKYLFPLLILLFTVPAFAQEDSANRLELSQQLHQIKPIKPQIDRAISNVATRLPVNKRKSFEATVKRSLSYKAIETFSIQAMAEIFTGPELDAMIAYYSKAEAKSAAEKLPDYQDKLRPEITKMLDKAMMEMRTGGSGG